MSWLRKHGTGFSIISQANIIRFLQYLIFDIYDEARSNVSKFTKNYSAVFVLLNFENELRKY